MSSTSLVRSRYAREWLDLPPRRSGGVVRYVVAVAIGAGSTLAWQYDSEVRDGLAGAFPQLGWLAPSRPASTAPAVASPLRSTDRQQIQELSAGFAALRERVDQLSQQVAALQPQRRVEQTGNAATMPLPRHFVGISSPAAASAAPIGSATDAWADATTNHTGDAQPQAIEPAIPAASALSQDEVCRHDAARLARLRMTQDRDEVAGFEHALGCEELRPQVLRLRESVDPR